MSIQIFILIYFIAYLAICAILPSVLVWKRTGRNPIVFGRSDNVYDYIGRTMKIVFALAFVSVAIFAFAPSIYQILNPFVLLEVPLIQAAGVVILIVSLVWTSVAQMQMRNSWRIGIDQVNRTDLVGNGLFAYSRNPIFLGMILTIWGLFLVLPNSLTLLVGFCGYLLIQIQVRLEEEFLSKMHGDVYLQYQNRVRRWL